MQDGERARIGVDRHTERLRNAVGADVTVLSARSSEEVGAERWRALSASADPHFLEIWADGILLPIIRSATNDTMTLSGWHDPSVQGAKLLGVRPIAESYGELRGELRGLLTGIRSTLDSEA